MTQQRSFLAITGPTTSGKTDLSLAIAERMPVEIVSMDSRQVYIGMDVGTDKVGAVARTGVAHHGLDLVRPDERYSAGRFGRDARRWMEQISARRRIPLLVGGTGFFLRAIIDPIFSEPRLDEARLSALRDYLGDQNADRLARWVSHLDPVRAELAIQGGPQRMSRTLEVALLSGKPLSQWHREAPPEVEALWGTVVVLDLPREEMDRRIDERVARMVEGGLVQEVRRLLDAGYTEADPGMSGTGYREIAAHLRGEATLDEAAEETRRNTRRYARRQLTWFRNQLPDSAVWIDATLTLEEQAEAVLAAWKHADGTAGSPGQWGPIKRARQGRSTG